MASVYNASVADRHDPDLRYDTDRTSYTGSDVTDSPRRKHHLSTGSDLTRVNSIELSEDRTTFWLAPKLPTTRSLKEAPITTVIVPSTPSVSESAGAVDEEPPRIDIDLQPESRPSSGLRGAIKAPPAGEPDHEDDKHDHGARTSAVATAETELPPEAVVDSVEAAVVDPISRPPQPTRPAPTVDGPGEKSSPQSLRITQFAPKPRLVDADGALKKKGRRKILVQKHLMQTAQLGINGFFIFVTWWWSRYYYVLLPFITATVALNIFMIISIVLRRTWNAVSPETVIQPETPESLVLLVPCYNETKEELVRSLDSLARQRHIEAHKQAIIIVCDGKVRGPGMEKSTGDYLLQDILVGESRRRYIPGAYTAWDQQPMDVVTQKGTYGGVPYLCIVKQQNQGKRDGLIVARSFLFNFNRRREEPQTIFTEGFFHEMASFLAEDAGIEHVDHLVGMDADTVFDDDCIDELLKQSRYPQTVGVCGYVAVDWKQSHWNLWRLYQSAEYTIAQGLRRLHQSMVTHKVSCLPGCCQLLKICEETCGDHVLLDLFGYCPDVTDGLLRQIRATASEDRNHVCHMLSARPSSQTRQALRAKAYTDVPKSWSVFLSQRRRWTLGATSNDLLLVTAPGVQWFERILATVNVFTWFLNPFIFACIASFVFACLVVAPWIILCFVGVMIIPVVYYACIPLWLCDTWKTRFQFWAGCAMYIVCGPFINIFVLTYATIYMDSFGWGKTRKVISDDKEGGAASSETELERLEKGSSSSSSSLARVVGDSSQSSSPEAASSSSSSSENTPRAPDQAALAPRRSGDVAAEEARLGG